MRTQSHQATKSTQRRGFHPYETTLSRDALLAEMDEQPHVWSEYQAIETVFDEELFTNGR